MKHIDPIDILVHVAFSLFTLGIWFAFIFLFALSVKFDPVLSIYIAMIIMPPSFIMIGNNYDNIRNFFKRIFLKVLS